MAAAGDASSLTLDAPAREAWMQCLRICGHHWATFQLVTTITPESISR